MLVLGWLFWVREELDHFTHPLVVLHTNTAVLQPVRVLEQSWAIEQSCDGSTTNIAGVPGFAPVCHRGHSEHTLVIAGHLIPGWPQVQTLETLLCYPAIRSAARVNTDSASCTTLSAISWDRLQYHICSPRNSLPLFILTLLFCLFLWSALWHFSPTEKKNYHIYHSFTSNSGYLILTELWGFVKSISCGQVLQRQKSLYKWKHHLNIHPTLQLKTFWM